MLLMSSECLDSAASELADVWLNAHLSGAQALEKAAAVVARQPTRADAEKLRALSEAFHALHWVFTRWRDPAFRDFTDAQLRAVRQVAWPRATRLAEVAWAWSRVYFPDHHAQALALLQTQHRLAIATTGADAQDPPLDRVWLYAALGALYSVAGEHARALDCGLQAELLATETGHDLAVSKAAQALAFIYLSAGDVEGASSVLPPGMAAAQRCGSLTVGMPFNHLLSLLLGQRFDAAAALLDEFPILLLPQHLSEFPSLKAMVARVRLSQGRREEAADLPPAGWTLGVSEPHTMAANRLWVSADVLLGLGRPGDARRLLEAGLETFRAAGVVLSPLNATQCHRALASACEAEGDLTAAISALRESQSHCFSWLDQSMRARLQALHFCASRSPVAQLQHRQSLRLNLVQQALSEARDVTANPALASRPRDDLLAQVAHEVRNPLHGVVWMTSMLMMSNLDERQREYLDLANSSARMALNLCNDVLDLAKMEAGKFSLSSGPVDLRILVAESAKVFAAPAQAKGVDMHWHCDPFLPAKVSGDRLRLQQVLMNLLSNATKFTHAGRIDVGVLWLGADEVLGEPTVRLSVTDTGPGVSAQLLPRLFQEFEQDTSEPGRAQGGAGLGLALCRQFVRMMGGEIGVNNRPGTGCTFWCLLPLPAL